MDAAEIAVLSMPHTPSLLALGLQPLNTKSSHASSDQLDCQLSAHATALSQNMVSAIKVWDQ